jgi:Skp family chaperone for outer membrane proteins
MKVNCRLLLLFSALVIATLSGCLPFEDNPRKQDIVFLDPVAIAKALGKDTVFSENEEAARIYLNNALERIYAELNRKLGEEKARYGDKLTGEEQQKLDAMSLSNSQTLLRTRRIAQQKLSGFRQQLINEFHNEIAMIAKPIADMRGAVAIKIIDSGIIWIDPSADITGEVIAGMRARSSEPREATKINNKDRKAPSPGTDEELARLNQLVDEIENKSKHQ